MLPTPADTNYQVRQRQRSSVACQSCGSRRVRCNVSRTGPPCTNCLDDRIDCNVTSRTNPPSIQIHNRLKPQTRKSPHTITPIVPTPRAEKHWDDDPPASLASPGSTWQNALDSRTITSDHAGRVTKERVDGLPITSPIEEKPAQQDSKQNKTRSGYQVALEGGVKEDAVPFYIGEQQGFGFFLDVYSPNRELKGNHFPVPRATIRSHSADGVNFRPMHGVFSWPPSGLCQKLLQSYFCYVYPLQPIINPGSFLENYTQGGSESVSCLLIWSMFFAGANYISKEVVSSAGYHSRKELKRALFKTAKYLYDADCEADKLTLIQSVMLLSFWYSDTEDRTGAWHWNGVAISLCHSLGLHRDPRSFGSQRQSFSSTNLSLWRRVWWSCYVREVWLSLGYGRPMRINFADCDVPLPSVEDILSGTAEISSQMSQDYLPTDCESLADLFVSMLDLTIKLGRILSTHYRVGAMPATTTEIERDEEGILRGVQEFQKLRQIDEIAKHHAQVVQFSYETVLIVLYRPYILGRPADVAPSENEAWHSKAMSRVKAAASKTTTLLNQFVIMDAIKTCPPTMVTLLKPAMQIYFLISISLDSLSRQHASLQLDLYMMVLGEMRDTFWTADHIYDVFITPRRKIDNQRHDSSPEHGNDREEALCASSNASRRGNGGSVIEPANDISFLPDEPARIGPCGFQTWTGLSSEIEWYTDIEPVLNTEEFNYLLT